MVSEKVVDENIDPAAARTFLEHVYARPGTFPREMWQGFGEEFRRLRNRVVRAFGDEKGKAILITSAIPGEGKTTVASNLAISLAQSKWRTLLIDSDLRKPTIHSLLKVSRGKGFSDLMKGRGSAQECERAGGPEPL